MINPTGKSPLQALAGAQQEFKQFLGTLLGRVADQLRDGGCSQPGEGETLEILETAAAGSLRQMEEAAEAALDWLLGERVVTSARVLAVVGALLEKVYINSTSIDDAQFLIKELALRVDRWRQGEAADAGEWDEIASSWRTHRAQRTTFSFENRLEPADSRRGEAEGEAVQLMEQLIAERDEATKRALRHAAEAEAALELERVALAEHVALLNAATCAQSEQAQQLARLAAGREELERSLAAREDELSSLRAECRALAEKAEAEALKAANVEESFIQVSERLKQRDAIADIVREREELRLLFTSLEAKNEEIKALLPFRERSEFHQKEAQRLAAEREQLQQEVVRLHEEVRRLRAKVKRLGTQNDELMTEKLLLEHRASQCAPRRGQFDRSLERNCSLRSQGGDGRGPQSRQMRRRLREAQQNRTLEDVCGADSDWGSVLHRTPDVRKSRAENRSKILPDRLLVQRPSGIPAVK